MYSIIITHKKKTDFKRNNVKTVYDGTETLTFLGPRTKLCQTTSKKVTALRNLI